MAKRVSVTRWLLKQSPEVVRGLEREGTFVEVGDSKRLNIHSMKLIVPMGIEVYHIIRKVRNLGEFFFLTREGQDMNPAYLSHVLADEEAGLNYARNVADLLRYPWYDNSDSSKLFERIANSSGRSNLYLIDVTRRTDRHPLSI